MRVFFKRGRIWAAMLVQEWRGVPKLEPRPQKKINAYE